MNRFHSAARRKGQALAELTITLVVLVILIICCTTLAHICLKQEHLQRTIRAESGCQALTRTSEGWSAEPSEEQRATPFHRINAITHLEQYAPALPSRLPMSNYTLATGTFPEAELNSKTHRRNEIIFLDPAFSKLLYPKERIILSAEVTFPATSGIWE